MGMVTIEKFAANLFTQIEAMLNSVRQLLQRYPIWWEATNSIMETKFLKLSVQAMKAKFKLRGSVIMRKALWLVRME
jgi:hypothetical protein